MIRRLLSRRLLSRRLLWPLCALAAVAALSACADDPAPPTAQELDEVGVKQVVARVERVELGRTHKGFILTAYAEADGIGWSRPQLRPRTGAVGEDGFFAFDFVASPAGPPKPQKSKAPPPPPPPGLTQKLRADTPVSDALMENAVGVRVFGAQAGAEIGFVVQP